MTRSPVSLCSDKLFKVLVTGSVGVGKSRIISIYVNKCFHKTNKPLIAHDFALKNQSNGTPKTVVRLQLWDVTGQEQFEKMSKVYYKGAALEWKQDLDSKVCLDSVSSVPAVLLANKCDMTEGNRELACSLDRFCKENSFPGCLETSTEDNINIDEAGAFLVKQMMLFSAGLFIEENHRDGIKVNQAPGEIQSQSLCCGRPRL
uniref:RAB32, member RAS onco family n=1 Tax=Myripristis murdjan TaxID=586833 RepID=A0A668AET4_9TELE